MNADNISVTSIKDKVFFMMLPRSQAENSIDYCFHGKLPQKANLFNVPA